MLVLRLKPRSRMKKKKHTPEQIISKLRKVEALTAEGAKQLGVSEQTVNHWKQYGGMDRDQLKRLNELEKENARLKKLLAYDLDNDILREALEGNY
jgi:type I site-specific restriction endonuclease